jgi:CRP-like cAMP-binding protein
VRAANAFAGLCDEDARRVGEAAVLRSAEPGQEIFAVRDGVAFSIFSIDAHFRVTQTTPMARQVIMRFVAPGQHFGDCAALAGQPSREESAIADRGGDYLELSAAALTTLADTMPALARALLAETAQLALEQADRIFELAALDLRHRLHAEILRLARSGTIEDGAVVIRPAPTHESFANLVGGTREGVTRELRTMAAQGLLQVRRRELKLINLERLKAQLASKSGARA